MAAKLKKKPVKKEEATPMIIKDNQGNSLATYDTEMVETIKNTVAKGASDSELFMFLSVAAQYDLNPFLKELWFIKMGGQPTIMTSKDGLVKICKKDPNCSKIQSGTVYENDEFEITYEDFEISGFKHRFNAKERGEILGAWASVTYKNDKKPMFVYVSFDEYNAKNSTWRKYPSAMIEKTAISKVCKLSADISGLYSPEEFNDFNDTKLNLGGEKNSVKEDSIEIIDVEIE